MSDSDGCESSIEGPEPVPDRRTCTKVHINGRPIGRAINLSSLSGYGDLVTLLEDTFGIRGELRGPNGMWTIVYLNHNGQTVILSDTPWREFCTSVEKIVLYSTDELIRMMRVGAMPVIS
ncbi:hypothetical protein AMTRI_Chr10g233370 [Amborella trichopoda]|uniref:PB1 domain-containing protein n=1 Tax=Amborella trichopoda TaxID=13333 RepID=U5D9A1_AMBTC|nr:hypothetical protein AMTR_s00061p00076820 [Amborella trichopoda]